MSITDAPLHQRLAARRDELSPAERVVAQFFVDHPQQVATASAIDIGQRTGTSNATVTRTAKALGYTGLPDLRARLIRAMTDRRDLAAQLGWEMEGLTTDHTPSAEGAAVGGLADTVAGHVLQATEGLIRRAFAELDPEEWRKATDIIDAAGSVFCYGVEQGGCVARLLSIGLGRSGKPSRSLTETGISISTGLLGLTGNDAVVLIAPIRHFREVDLVIDRANEVGAPAVLISETLGLALADRVQAVLSTPSTALDVNSEIVVPTALTHALVLDISNRHRENALATRDLVRAWRSRVVGAEVDVTIPPLDLDVPS